MNIYWEVLIFTAVLGVIFYRNKKPFVISAAAVHIFVCGFRYMHMHGDLQKYHSAFEEIMGYGWTSSDLWREGRNSLFYVLNKWIGQITNGNFQVLLFIIAFISTSTVAYVVYRYSQNPFMSFLLWSCMGFYMFTFYSIKQTLAMAIVMLAYIAVNEEKRVWFYILVLIAGLVHFPAFVFLPVYEITRIKDFKFLSTVYVLGLIALFFNRGRIVKAMTDVYYEGETTFDISSSGIGGKSLLIFAFLLVGLLLANTSHTIFRNTFVMILMASMFQLFSIYDNVFTRLADYYLQFIIIYAPGMFAQLHKAPNYPRLYFNKQSQKILTSVFCVLCVFYYYYTIFRGYNAVSPDDLIANFAFMWQK